MGKQIAVVGAVVVRDGRVLAARRGPAMSLPGTWEFPGGKIEPGEGPEQALVREMREELLCTVEIGAHVATTTHAYDFGTVTLTTFLARVVAGEPQPTEHSAVRWLSVDELGSVEWAPADLPAVERLRRILRT
ncbi:MAG TPA: (deoxy)nucleoside triphosphate pyrophosphohydrolase [Candidatus Avipropionibacterium avicola]|uniref:8-oxo-dGTP diphosphatase n=1 Tax=Candidatus Avipropionibacterium avicola TaxID=2840701 RepID=A0A9D1KNC8_9ACTN|nr:(deoxy)nucleoside triphosphate pyrophosphohydrolase [Candidatus Avipropionibacterium avicola]